VEHLLGSVTPKLSHLIQMYMCIMAWTR